MITLYLAGRYSRRLELCGYREQLRARGFAVTGRWLDGSHQIDNQGAAIGVEGERAVERGDAIAGKFAQDDFEDVENADILLAFTEQPREGGGRSRGGRHVELGLALAWAMPVIVVGPRENVFCWLPQVECVGTFSDALDSLEVMRSRWWPDEGPDENRQCLACDGEGEKLVCPDDMCRGSGECIHGDGLVVCAACDGTGDRRAPALPQADGDHRDGETGGEA